MLRGTTNMMKNLHVLRLMTTFVPCLIFNPENMVQKGNMTLVPLDGTVKVEYTRGGSVVVNDKVYPGRYAYECGHPLCNPKGLCIVIKN